MAARARGALRWAMILGLVAAALIEVAPRAAALALPVPNGQLDYQIGGAYPPVSSVAIVDRDRFDPPVPDRYNICYVNSFQTQPGSQAGVEGTAAWWKARHDNVLLRNSRGRYVTDPGYPDEILLDTRTAGSRSAIADIVAGWYRTCAGDGFQAVEPDNLDSWTRSRGLLTKANNVALARLLVAVAHESGVAIALSGRTSG